MSAYVNQYSIYRWIIPTDFTIKFTAPTYQLAVPEGDLLQVPTYKPCRLPLHLHAKVGKYVPHYPHHTLACVLIRLDVSRARPGDSVKSVYTPQSQLPFFIEPELRQSKVLPQYDSIICEISELTQHSLPPTRTAS